MQSLGTVGFAAILLAGPVAVFATEPVSVVQDDSVSNPRQPQAAVDEQGTIYVAFGAEGAIYVTKSSDRGRTFGQPIRIGRIPGLALGMRRGPRIVAGRGVVVVSAIGHTDGNLLAWHSSDGGESWTGPVRVNDSPGHASEGLHAMTMGPDGQTYCVWLDHRNTKTQIYGAGSQDGGRTWTENRMIYASPDGNVCECCHPSATYSASGDLFVMWRNSLEGYRDMYFTVSKDSGQSFGTPKKLGQGTWKLDACPMDGGSIAVSPQGKITTIWRREEQVFRIDADEQSEELLGEGIQPWAAATNNGAYLVWTSRRNGDLWLTTPSADGPRKLAENCTDPVVATSVSGEGPVTVVWEEEGKDNRGIHAAIVDSGS